jgi:exopolyphosphatase / guanosine-5'-triphosphate,3'-diphosphate pyrophosphatase
MIQIKKYAAIDIGSNAMRLLVTNIVEQNGAEPQFNKSSLVRVPIRLGQDSFTVGEISDENMLRMAQAMQAFALLMKVHKVERFKACATSAMREADNKQDVVDYIKNESGIEIDIIDGRKEASIIASSDLGQYMQSDKTYLYVDVGGGSTEFSLFDSGKIVASRSFRIGTVRLINNMVNELIWVEIEKWIRNLVCEYEGVTVIGSGGNINKLFKLTGKTQDKPLSYLGLQSLYSQLNQLTYEERISKFGLNPDRADVIVPASKIYLNSMKWSGAKQMYVPKIGLSDGIVKAMYYGKL